MYKDSLGVEKCGSPRKLNGLLTHISAAFFQLAARRGNAAQQHMADSITSHELILQVDLNVGMRDLKCTSITVIVETHDVTLLILG